MNKKILIVAALLMVVCVGGAFAWGIGVQGGGGYPVGGGAALTFKLDSPWVFAVDAHFGQHHTVIGLTADYWFVDNTLVNTPIGPFNWFLGGGFGVGLALGDKLGVRLAGRLPIGLNLMIPVASLALEPYVQLVPALGVNIGYGDLFYFGFDANLGLRLHF